VLLRVRGMAPMRLNRREGMARKRLLRAEGGAAAMGGLPGAARAACRMRGKRPSRRALP
jgi:hypothetical protein